MDEREDLLVEGGRGGAGVEQRREGHDRAEDNAPVRDLERAERLGEQAHDLDLRGGAVLADELDAELRELAGLAAQARLLAHDRRVVAEARRQAVCRDAAGHEAGDGQGEVRAEHEQRAVLVEELEGGVAHAGAALEGGAVLEQRGLHGQVAVHGKGVAHDAGDALAGERLAGKYVAEAAGGSCYHGVPLCRKMQR